MPDQVRHDAKTSSFRTPLDTHPEISSFRRSAGHTYGIQWLQINAMPLNVAGCRIKSGMTPKHRHSELRWTHIQKYRHSVGPLDTHTESSGFKQMQCHSTSLDAGSSPA